MYAIRSYYVPLARVFVALFESGFGIIDAMMENAGKDAIET